MFKPFRIRPIIPNHIIPNRIIPNRIITTLIMAGTRRCHFTSGAAAIMEAAGAAVGMVEAGTVAVDMVAGTADQSSAGSSRRLLVQDRDPRPAKRVGTRWAVNGSNLVRRPQSSNSLRNAAN